MIDLFRITINCALVSIWTFMITLGDVMDIKQISDNDMDCQNDIYDHRYNDDCSTKDPYDISYKIINVIGGTIGITHLSFHLAHVTYHILNRIRMTNFIFLFKNKFKIILGSSTSIGLSFLYQYAVYNKNLCSYNIQFCTNKPYSYETLRLVYTSLIVMGTITFFIYASYIATFFIIFYKNRIETWEDIIAYERALLVTKTIKEAFNDNTIRSSSTFQDFITFWSQKSDQSIIDDIPIKSKNIMCEFLGKMDMDKNNYISYEEFEHFAIRNCIFNIEYLWKIFTQNNKFDIISRESVEDLLYDLFFDRKQLALMILTDFRVLSYLILYSSYILYPAGLIVISKIFGYDNAFENGIDLFKTYAVIISYMFSKMANNLRFVGAMLFNRPYNIGDVLKIDDDTFTVVDFDSSNTILTGSAYMNICNRKLIDQHFLNLTKIRISDSFDMTIPLNSLYDEIDLSNSINDYITRYEKDIEPDSVRTGWIGVDSNGKTIRCNWKYKFRIMDRSRLNKTRTNIINHLYSTCNHDVIRSYYSAQIASGGGLNDDKTIKEHAENEINYRS